MPPGGPSFSCVRYALLYESDLIIPLSTAVEDMLKNGKDHTLPLTLELLMSLSEEGAGQHVLQNVGNMGADSRAVGSISHLVTEDFGGTEDF